MASTAKVQESLDLVNSKLDELNTTLDTELTEISAALTAVVDGGGIGDLATKGLTDIAARVDGLKERVAGIITPETEPNPDES